MRKMRIESRIRKKWKTLEVVQKLDLNGFK
jgi:hypothetical protein